MIAYNGASAIRIGTATLPTVLFPYLLSIASGLGKLVHIGYCFHLVRVVFFERSIFEERIAKTS